MSKSIDNRFSGVDEAGFDVKIHVHEFISNLENWQYSNVNSRTWRLYYNETSGAQITSNGQIFILDESKLILIPPYTNFATVSHGKFNHFFIHFSAPCPFDHVRRKILSFDGAMLKKYLPILKKEPADFRLPILLRLVIFDALAKISPDFFLPEAEDSLHPKIKLAIDIMNNEIDRPLSCVEIANRLKMPLNTYYILFKKATGITSKTYLLNVKMEKAAFLLRHSSCPIKEIADITGFSDRYHFSKVFRAFFGKTPVAFRKAVIAVKW